jgi:predicted amidohydrolase YtcJ
MALAGDRIIAIGSEPPDLDELIGPDTICLDLPDRCILPGFVDAHVHQLEAIQDLGTVDVASARTIDDVLRLCRDAAAVAPAGSWVVSHRGWHESNLSEGRLPTTAELDRVSTAHPVMVRRGSHAAVLNTAGLTRASREPTLDLGVRGPASETRDTQIRGRELIRSILERDAVFPADDGAALAKVCALHAARGIVWARDAGLGVDDVATYETLDARGELPVRTDVMITVPRNVDHAEKLAFIADLGPPPTPRGTHLTVTAIKLFADGHVADAALRPGSGRDGATSGELLMTAPEIAELAARAVTLGWRVGCHVVGDRALDGALDAYESVLRANPTLLPGRLVIEHALVADDAQRRRTAQLGVGVTVQHPLLDLYGAQMVAEWGPELANRANPVRGWLAAGALVAAGSDGHVAPVDPLRSIAGLATRQTMAAGALGPDEAVPIETAVRLYTVATGWLMSFGNAAAGLIEGGLADFVVFDRCVLEANPARLDERLAPVLTVCGGRSTHAASDLEPLL